MAGSGRIIDRTERLFFSAPGRLARSRSPSVGLPVFLSRQNPFASKLRVLSPKLLRVHSRPNEGKNRYLSVPVMAAKMALVPLANPFRMIRHPGRLQFILQSRFYTAPVPESVYTYLTREHQRSANDPTPEVEIRERLMSGVKTAIKVKQSRCRNPHPNGSIMSLLSDKGYCYIDHISRKSVQGSSQMLPFLLIELVSFLVRAL